MRTTLTLDDDVAAKLKELVERHKSSFREEVNAVLRRGLSVQERSERRPKPFRVATFRSAFRPGVDPLKLNQLSDDLEVEQALERIARAERK
jgi:plasmid stability protein